MNCILASAQALSQTQVTNNFLWQTLSPSLRWLSAPVVVDMLSERRNSPRKSSLVKVILRIGDTPIRTTTVDVSATGAFVATRETPKIGEEVSLLCRCPDEKIFTIHIIATVARIVAPGEGAQPGIGLRFISGRCPQGRERFTRFLRHVLGVRLLVYECIEPYLFGNSLLVVDRDVEVQSDLTGRRDGSGTHALSYGQDHSKHSTQPDSRSASGRRSASRRVPKVDEVTLARPSTRRSLSFSQRRGAGISQPIALGGGETSPSPTERAVATPYRATATPSAPKTTPAVDPGATAPSQKVQSLDPSTLAVAQPPPTPTPPLAPALVTPFVPPAVPSTVAVGSAVGGGSAPIIDVGLATTTADRSGPVGGVVSTSSAPVLPEARHPDDVAASCLPPDPQKGYANATAPPVVTSASDDAAHSGLRRSKAGGADAERSGSGRPVGIRAKSDVVGVRPLTAQVPPKRSLSARRSSTVAPEMPLLPSQSTSPRVGTKRRRSTLGSSGHAPPADDPSRDSHARSAPARGNSRRTLSDAPESSSARRASTEGRSHSVGRLPDAASTVAADPQSNNAAAPLVTASSLSDSAAEQKPLLRRVLSSASRLFGGGEKDAGSESITRRGRLLSSRGGQRAELRDAEGEQRLADDEGHDVVLETPPVPLESVPFLHEGLRKISKPVTIDIGQQYRPAEAHYIDENTVILVGQGRQPVLGEPTWLHVALRVDGAWLTAYLLGGLRTPVVAVPTGWCAEFKINSVRTPEQAAAFRAYTRQHEPG